jgi:hypothetical protein
MTMYHRRERGSIGSTGGIPPVWVNRGDGAAEVGDTGALGEVGGASRSSATRRSRLPVSVLFGPPGLVGAG